MWRLCTASCLGAWVAVVVTVLCSVLLCVQAVALPPYRSFDQLGIDDTEARAALRAVRQLDFRWLIDWLEALPLSTHCTIYGFAHSLAVLSCHLTWSDGLPAQPLFQKGQGHFALLFTCSLQVAFISALAVIRQSPQDQQQTFFVSYLYFYYFYIFV